MSEITGETLATLEKMLEPLPDSAQHQAIEHLQEYIAELQSERRWEQLHQDYKPGLEQMARLAKQQISDGKARRLHLDEL